MRSPGTGDSRWRVIWHSWFMLARGTRIVEGNLARILACLQRRGRRGDIIDAADIGVGMHMMALPVARPDDDPPAPCLEHHPRRRLVAFLLDQQADIIVDRLGDVHLQRQQRRIVRLGMIARQQVLQRLEAAFCRRADGVVFTFALHLRQQRGELAVGVFHARDMPAQQRGGIDADQLVGQGGPKTAKTARWWRCRRGPSTMLGECGSPILVGLWQARYVSGMAVLMRLISLVLIVTALMLLGADAVTSLEKGGELTVRSLGTVWADRRARA